MAGLVTSGAPVTALGQALPVTTGSPIGMGMSFGEPFQPAVMKGIKIFPDNPFRFDFLIDSAESRLRGEALRWESIRLIKYFLTALTIPEEDFWVNLSPYESDQIIPKEFGRTAMGRDLLAQDYLLKQISASLMDPESTLGEAFWDRVYTKAYKLYGTTHIPVNTFNKIWIVPEKAEVYENEDKAFVTQAHLAVMLQEDYLLMNEHLEDKKTGMDRLDIDDIEQISAMSSNVMRQVILPELEKEVNEGKAFAPLRQIYYSMILATWFKNNLKENLLAKIYVDKKKTAGVDSRDPEAYQKIYRKYVEAFKKGAYNYIREDYDPYSQQIIPRQYLSGGFLFAGLGNRRLTDSVEPVLKVVRAKATGSAATIRRTFQKVTNAHWMSTRLKPRMRGRLSVGSRPEKSAASSLGKRLRDLEKRGWVRLETRPGGLQEAVVSPSLDLSDLTAIEQDSRVTIVSIKSPSRKRVRQLTSLGYFYKPEVVTYEMSLPERKPGESVEAGLRRFFKEMKPDRRKQWQRQVQKIAKQIETGDIELVEDTSGRAVDDMRQFLDMYAENAAERPLGQNALASVIQREGMRNFMKTREAVYLKKDGKVIAGLIARRLTDRYSLSFIAVNRGQGLGLSRFLVQRFVSKSLEQGFSVLSAWSDINSYGVQLDTEEALVKGRMGFRPRLVRKTKGAREVPALELMKITRYEQLHFPVFFYTIGPGGDLESTLIVTPRTLGKILEFQGLTDQTRVSVLLGDTTLVPLNVDINFSDRAWEMRQELAWDTFLAGPVLLVGELFSLRKSARQIRQQIHDYLEYYSSQSTHDFAKVHQTSPDIVAFFQRYQMDLLQGGDKTYQSNLLYGALEVLRYSASSSLDVARQEMERLGVLAPPQARTASNNFSLSTEDKARQVIRLVNHLAANQMVVRDVTPANLIFSPPERGMRPSLAQLKAVDQVEFQGPVEAFKTYREEIRRTWTSSGEEGVIKQRVLRHLNERIKKEGSSFHLGGSGTTAPGRNPETTYLMEQYFSSFFSKDRPNIIYEDGIGMDAITGKARAEDLQAFGRRRQLSFKLILSERAKALPQWFVSVPTLLTRPDVLQRIGRQLNPDNPVSANRIRDVKLVIAEDQTDIVVEAELPGGRRFFHLDPSSRIWGEVLSFIDMSKLENVVRGASQDRPTVYNYQNAQDERVTIRLEPAPVRRRMEALRREISDVPVHLTTMEDLPGEISNAAMGLANNVLTYMTPAEQQAYLRSRVKTLRPGGVLVVKNSESHRAGDQVIAFDVVDVFQKRRQRLVYQGTLLFNPTTKRPFSKAEFERYRPFIGFSVLRDSPVKMFTKLALANSSIELYQEYFQEINALTRNLSAMAGLMREALVSAKDSFYSRQQKGIYVSDKLSEYLEARLTEAAKQQERLETMVRERLSRQGRFVVQQLPPAEKIQVADVFYTVGKAIVLTEQMADYYEDRVGFYDNIQTGLRQLRAAYRDLIQMFWGPSLGREVQETFQPYQASLQKAYARALEAATETGQEKDEIAGRLSSEEEALRRRWHEAFGRLMDKAASSSPDQLGGIDLTRRRMRLETRGRGVDWDVPVDEHVIEIMAIDGLDPVIFQMVPVSPSQIPMLLGLQPRGSLTRGHNT